MSAARVEYATAHNVFAVMAGGGSISVEEWTDGDLQAEARRREKQTDGTEGLLLVKVSQDVVGGAPDDIVSMHPDECDRLALFDRAIDALESAKGALKACGYVDHATRTAADV